MKSKAPAEIKHVCAVVVTYNIGEAFIPNFEAVRQQVGHVVVVDNGSTDDTLSVLKDLSDTYPGTLEIIHNDENNLAKAQNVGIDHARNLGFGWVLLLDHDSLATKDMVATMLNAYNHSLNRQRIGIVAPYLDDANTCKKPRYLRAKHGVLFERVCPEDEPVLDNVLSVIASGSLIPVSVLDNVGTMDEDFIIDYIDKDFSLRLITKGYRIMVVRNAVLKHRLGQSRDHHLLGQRITTTNHCPLRRYYIYRNRLKTWGRFVFTVPAFVVFDVMAVVYDIGRILCYESDKLAKFSAMLAGVRDAFRGVRGTKPSLIREEKALKAVADARK